MKNECRLPILRKEIRACARDQSEGEDSEAVSGNESTHIS